MADDFKDVFVPNIQTANKTNYNQWKSSNPGEAAKWEKFRDDVIAGKTPTAPALSTKYGKALVSAGKLRMSVTDLGAAPLPLGVVPSAPTGLAAVAGNAQISLSWTANPPSELVDNYQIYEGGQIAVASVPSASSMGYILTLNHLGQPLVNGTTYDIRVSAHNATGTGQWSNQVSATPAGASGRYLDINFAAHLYAGEGITEVLEAVGTDARLSSWGGLPSDYYDNPGAFGYTPGTSMTTDANQRVHLFDPVAAGLPANPAGGQWASWQELRTTDGQWQTGYNLAKASLNIPTSATFGSDPFSFGDIRWWAFDILFPSGIGGVSYECPQSGWSVLGDMHSNGGDADPGLTRLLPTGGSFPKNYVYSTTWDNHLAYLDVTLMQLWDSSGNRVSANFNVWHEVVIGQKLTSDTTGWFEIWFDGVQKAPQTARQLLSPLEVGPYFQMQNYTQWPLTFVGGATRSAVVFGGFRGGLNRSDVQTR